MMLATILDRAYASAMPWGDCLLVTEWKPMSNGYVRAPRLDGTRKQEMLHRLVVGDIGAEMTVDHSCHNDSGCPGGPCLHRRCIRREHLISLDAVENWKRGTQGVVAQRRARTVCPAGHPYEEANLRASCAGRACKACHRARQGGRDPMLEPTYL